MPLPAQKSATISFFFPRAKRERSTASLVKWFGLRSYNYWFEETAGGSGGEPGEVLVNGQSVDSLDGLYAIWQRNARK